MYLCSTPAGGPRTTFPLRATTSPAKAESTKPLRAGVPPRAKTGGRLELHTQFEVPAPMGPAVYYPKSHEEKYNDRNVLTMAAASEQVGVQTAATTEQPPAEATNSHPGPWEGSASSKSAAEKERLRRAVVVHSVTLPKRRVDEGVAQTEQEEEDKRRTAEVRNLVSQASQVAGAVFVTELSSGFYESFSRGWREWAGVIGAEEQ